MRSGERSGSERSEEAQSERDEDAQRERDGETGDWSETLAYGSDSEATIPGQDRDSEHWSRWYLGMYLGAALLLVGALRGSLLLLVAGYLLVPPAIYLDSRYLDSVTTGWKPDMGLYLVGSLLFPVLLIPMYLYRRRELRGGG